MGFHVAGDVGYVRYFTAFIYEFQFYRALCLESGQYVPGDPEKPLHRCNFYGSKKAGEKMTGQRKMSTKALREYFEPLEVWLRNENEKSGVEVGWGTVDVEKVCRQAGPDPASLSWAEILLL